MENLSIFEWNGFRLELTIDRHFGILEFSDLKGRFIIVKDFSLYVVDTLIKSLDAFLFKDPSSFEMSQELPLGLYFNKYSFELGHDSEYKDLKDPTENYMIFGDQGCLFLYRYCDLNYFEISNIYEYNNSLDFGGDSLDNWLNEKFFSVQVPVTSEMLNEMFLKLILIREKLFTSQFWLGDE